VTGAAIATVTGVAVTATRISGTTITDGITAAAFGVTRAGAAVTAVRTIAGIPTGVFPFLFLSFSLRFLPNLFFGLELEKPLS